MEQTLRAGRARRDELESQFIGSLPDIERMIRYVARRHRLSEAEADDFAGEVKLALIEGDYEVLARFQAHSSLRTYLMTVVQRLFLDYRRKSWGKWRPSAEAQRRGPVALRLEMLLYRDGLSFDEAVETLQTNFAATESRAELAELAHELPPRPRRRPEAGGVLATVPAGESASPEVQVEGALTAARTQALIAEVMATLPAQERLVLRLRFEDGLSVADIARMLKLDQRPLYRRVEGLLASFRACLQGRGLGWPEVERMIERGQCHLCLPRTSGKTGAEDPSQGEGQD
jgi:RNA polymerase sigma factor for flagellar operon FliA